MKTPMEVFIKELRKLEMPYQTRFDILDMAVILANDSIKQGANIYKPKEELNTT